MKEMETMDIRETTKAAERMECGEVSAEQMEMDAMNGAKAAQEMLAEQQEMEAFEGGEKVGRRRIYDPCGAERYEKGGRPGEERIGEYRIFNDTRPGGSRYDIFADGR